MPEYPRRLEGIEMSAAKSGCSPVPVKCPWCGSRWIIYTNERWWCQTCIRGDWL